MTLDVRVIQGSILDADAEAIVNAANSRGVMGGGVAGVIKRAAGREVEQEATRQAPIEVGTAVVTSGGRTRFRAIIHAPTMTQPAMTIPAENVALATRASLRLADQQGFQSIAMPGMGTGIGGVTHGEAARRMIHEIRAFAGAQAPSRALSQVVLTDVDAAMVQAWRGVLSAPE